MCAFLQPPIPQCCRHPPHFPLMLFLLKWMHAFKECLSVSCSSGESQLRVGGCLGCCCKDVKREKKIFFSFFHLCVSVAVPALVPSAMAQRRQ